LLSEEADVLFDFDRADLRPETGPVPTLLDEGGITD
jgi:hypothetical protein